MAHPEARGDTGRSHGADHAFAALTDKLAYLETGAYSANILLSDLNLPSGVRWMLEELGETYDTVVLEFGASMSE